MRRRRRRRRKRRRRRRKQRWGGGGAAGGVGQDEPVAQGAVEPAEHRVGGGGRQHVRGPVERLPPLLRQGRALPPGLRPRPAAAAARPAAQPRAAPHRPLPALGDVPHRAAGRQPLRSRLRPPAQPRARARRG